MAIKLHTGLLKKKVIFKAPVKVTNDEGGPEVSYPSNTLITWAHVQRVSDNRINEANAEALLNAKEFFIRWSEEKEAINIEYQLVYNNQEYTITGIELINEAERWIRITAKTKNG